MYKRIVVPLDGSELAAGVLPYVRTLAKGIGAEVELVRCFEPVSATYPDPSPTMNLFQWFPDATLVYQEEPRVAELEGAMRLDKVIQNFASKARDALQETGKTLQQDGIKVSYEVHEGDPATKILERAGQEPETLIAISTHGRSGLTRWLMGSVTSKVLQAAQSPMLIVRPRQQEVPKGPASISRMIVPLDGSPVAEQILPHAVEVAKLLDLGIILARVTPAPADYYRYMEYPVGQQRDFFKDVDDMAVEYLEGVNHRLENEGVRSVEHHLLHGQPAASVIDLAHETPDSLVAMTTHGRSGVGRWMLGSVADRVVRYSGNPVFLLRAQEE